MAFISPGNITFEKDAHGIFHCSLKKGKTYRNISCIPLFPISGSEEFISVNWSADVFKTEEIGILRDLKEFSPQQRDIVRDNIKTRYLLPEITDVIKIRKNPGVFEWHVITDRGEKKFYFRFGHDAIISAGNKVIIITDMDYCRYKVTDMSKLPPRGRAELDKVIL